MNAEKTISVGEPLSESELCPNELLNGQEAAFRRDIERLQKRRGEFVSVTCPACASVASRPAFEKFGFQYLSCSDCRTLYMSPRPSPEVMADYYRNSENYRYWAEHIFPASENSRREKIHKPWLERVIGYCERFSPPHPTLLEVGAGFGTFSELALQSGFFRQVTAVEPTPEMAQSCRRRGIPVIELGIEAVHPAEVRADVIVAFEVVEHLFAPVDFCAKCAGLLGDRGILVISCPNGLGFDIATLGAQALAVDAEHVNLMNPVSISRLLQRQNFELLDVSTPGRLDAEFVRLAALEGKIELSTQPLLQRILIDDWETLGWPFQQFLAANNLSSHMWVVARRS